jgi:hypothetical protein
LEVIRGSPAHNEGASLSGEITQDAMRKSIYIIPAAAASLVVAGYLVAKATVPLSFASRSLHKDAVDHVLVLQSNKGLSPGECAQRYIYFNTDYHLSSPTGIIVTTDELGEGSVRITIHNPDVKDDSEHERVDRVYLEAKEDAIWTPIKHEWSHKGRGNFGWTTKPTS